MGRTGNDRSLDAIRRRLLSYFVYIDYEEKKDFPTIGNIIKYGKNDFIAAVKIPMYERKGDKTDSWGINTNIGSGTRSSTVNTYRLDLPDHKIRENRFLLVKTVLDMTIIHFIC